MSGSCVCFLCLLTVCHLQVKRCVNAPPTRLPILVPIAFSRLCLRLASALCPFHFVLHDSGRTDLPTFPCVTNRLATGLGHDAGLRAVEALWVVSSREARLLSLASPFLVICPAKYQRYSVFTILGCSMCRECTPCQTVSRPLHDSQPFHTRLTKSFVQASTCPSLLLTQ